MALFSVRFNLAFAIDLPPVEDSNIIRAQ